MLTTVVATTGLKGHTLVSSHYTSIRVSFTKYLQVVGEVQGEQVGGNGDIGSIGGMAALELNGQFMDW